MVRWEYTVLCLLVLVNLAVHFCTINNPSELVLDEIYYVTDAQQILETDTLEHREHPPLGKLIIAANIALFGNNSVGGEAFMNLAEQELFGAMVYFGD